MKNSGDPYDTLNQFTLHPNEQSDTVEVTNPTFDFNILGPSTAKALLADACSAQTPYKISEATTNYCHQTTTNIFVPRNTRVTNPVKRRWMRFFSTEWNAKPPGLQALATHCQITSHSFKAYKDSACVHIPGTTFEWHAVYLVASHTIEENITDFLHQTAKSGQTSRDCHIKRKAFLEGQECGMFTFITRGLVETATFDSICTK